MPKEETKSRDEVLAAREAKKLAKLKAKNKVNVPNETKEERTKEGNKLEKEQKGNVKEQISSSSVQNEDITKSKPLNAVQTEMKSPKGKDEVDKAVINKTETDLSDKNKDVIKAERAVIKAAKQAKKKGLTEARDEPAQKDMTVKDVVETLKDIVNVVKDVQDVTAKVQAISFEPKKQEETGKSKAELRAERRAKQEAQRAAKQAASEEKAAAKPKPDASVKTIKSDDAATKTKAVSPVKTKVEKSKPKSQYVQRINWFQHLSTGRDKESLKNIPLNSNLHPAIIKLGVQLASKVVSGSNARCIALLDALKKMVRDYTLPAKTEFGRGLEAHLAASLDYLWSMRQPSASQTNAVKYFRRHLTQLPNNVDDYDAKKTLQDAIDNYIREQIETAGEAISLAVRNKICNGDNILTYGCSSLIERILREAWEANVRFHTVVVGHRVHSGGRQMLRRLSAHHLPCTYVDIIALSFVMKNVQKVVVGASSLLSNGSVLGAAGTAQVALQARAHNVPLLVACETHKFSERVQTDAFVYNEIGDPDALIDENDENSPLKDWRSNPNLTPLNLTYDVTPPSLVTAVVTELAILPCTSAPVVLRTKLAEHSI